MSSAPTISVITAAYQAAKTLRDTIASLEAQTSADFEWVLIDGASTDETARLFEEANLPHKRMISEPDQGVYDAMNKGIRLARGSYLAFLNSDDVYLDHTVSQVIEFISRQPCDIVYGNMITERRLGKRQFFRQELANLDELDRGMFIFHPSTFTRRELFERLGLYQLEYKLAADYHWFLQARLRGAQFGYLNANLAKFRLGGMSTHSCESYREAALIQAQLGSRFAPATEVLYQRCKRSAPSRQLIAKFAQSSLFKPLYEYWVSKRWS